MQNRLEELRKCQEDLDFFLNHVDEEEQEMLINCIIDVQLVQKKSSESPVEKEEKQQWT